MKGKSFEKFGRSLFATSLTLSVLLTPAVSGEVHAAKPQLPKHEVKLRLMETTDVHMNLLDFDYYRESSTEEFGFSRTATLIKQARKEIKNSMLFDNGDLYQGTLLGTYKASVDKLRDGEVHPALKAMNHLDYDAATLGNHEFNYGLEYLDEVLDDSSFPYVNANIYWDDHDKNPYNDKNYFKPYQILHKTITDENGKKQKLKVGVIGFVPPQILKWDKAHLEGKVITKDIVKTAEKYVPEMKKNGADIIIALSHSGIAHEKYSEMDENATVELAKVNGIDAIFAGHNHKLFPGDFNGIAGVDNEKGLIYGKPVIMPGKWGDHLGIMDLTLQKKKGKWKVKESTVELRAVYDLVNKKSLAQPDPFIFRAIEKEHFGTLDYLQQSIGNTTTDIHSYFAVVQDNPSVQIVTNAQMWYIDKTLKGTPDEELPVLSAGAPFKAGGRNGASYYTYIPKGSMSIKSAADLYLYDNTVATIKITGADVREWLEMIAQQFNQIDPNKQGEQNLINNSFQSYKFDTIDGVSYQIDVTEPAKYSKDGSIINPNANRIKNLEYNGKPIDDNQEFIVVTNNYRASADWPGIKNAKDVQLYPDENRQIVIDYITELKIIDSSADNNWSFAPVSRNPNIVFDSSPEARKVISESSPIQYVGESANGFAEYSFQLPSK